jgi:hypothetical protein
VVRPLRLLPGLLLAAGLLSGCGTRPGGLDRHDPHAVYRAAMRAAYDGDWKTLSGLLTTDARIALRSDVERLQKNLGALRPGSPLHESARAALGKRYEAEVAIAVHGDLGDVLRFWVRAWPRPRDPPPRAMKLDSLHAEIFYEGYGGVERVVKLVRVRGLWEISELPL